MFFNMEKGRGANRASQMASEIRQKAKKMSMGGEVKDNDMEMMNKGGMCYAEGGEVHPLAMMLKRHMAANGGLKEPMPAQDQDYTENEEVNEQLEDRMDGLSGPELHVAPMSDEDRKDFVRSIMVKRAMKRI